MTPAVELAALACDGDTAAWPSLWLTTGGGQDETVELTFLSPPRQISPIDTTSCYVPYGPRPPSSNFDPSCTFPLPSNTNAFMP